MANLRIVHNNVADNYLSLTASSEAGTLVATNLVADLKSKVWRGATLSETLTVTWATTQTIRMVALPFCNLSATATIRVQLYTNVGDATPILDTGAVLSNAYTVFDQIGWGAAPPGVNSFYYGGGTYATVWFALQSVTKAVISIVDTGSANAYVEASRLVIGDYWTPLLNFDHGAKLELVDNSKHQRTESGDLVSSRGIRYKKLTMQFSYMQAADRTQMLAIIQANGKHTPMFLSMFPESTDLQEAQMYQIYGKQPTLSGLRRVRSGRDTGSLVLEEL